MKTIIFTLLTLSLLVSSSCKKKGCIDSDATNYDSKAKKDDGSCVYSGLIADPISIASSPRYSIVVDGVLEESINQSNITQAFSSSGISLGSFFYNYVTDYTNILIEREGLTSNGGGGFTDLELISFFTVGSYNYSNSNGLDVVVEGAPGVFYHSNIGDQTGSSFNIVTAENDNSGIDLHVKVYMEFNCKVYNSDDLSDVKVITNGKLVTYFKDL